MSVGGQATGTAGVRSQFGCESATAKLRRVLVRRLDEAACNRWREFGWRGAPDHRRLLREHEDLCALLESAGAEVIVGEQVAGGLDAIYAFDPAIVSRQGAIVLRPGKELRRPEAAAAVRDMIGLDIPVAAQLEPPAIAEGGDLLWLDRRTLLVGRGYRTNGAGTAFLKSVLPDVELIEFDLPHHRGAEEVMHLLSLISLVASDVALVYLPLLPVRLVELLRERDVRLIEVPDDEFETMGPNALAVEPGVVVALERNRQTLRRLERAGVSVLTYRGVELSKGDGGPTCLTQPILRAG